LIPHVILQDIFKEDKSICRKCTVSALSVQNLSQKTRKLFDKDGERHTTWFLDVFGAGSFSDFGLRGRPALEWIEPLQGLSTD